MHAEHRNLNVLHLLWRGIATYADERKARFLIGCSSLSSQEPAEGEGMYRQLRSHLVEAALRTSSRPEFSVTQAILPASLEGGAISRSPSGGLDVESQDVVQGEAKLGYGRLVLKSAVGSVPIVVMKEEGQMGGADA